jgi:hypothetical protein
MNCPLYKQDDQSKFWLPFYTLESLTLCEAKNIHTYRGEHWIIIISKEDIAFVFSGDLAQKRHKHCVGTQ